MKVVTKDLANIALEKRFLIDDLELTGYFYSEELNELRAMCNILKDGKRTGGRLKTLTIDDWISLKDNTDGFKDCITLESVSLRLSDNFLLARHFSGCKSLKCIDLRGNGGYYTIDGVLYAGSEYNRSKSRLVKYPANKGTEFTIPEYVVEIDDLAFEDCQLTTLTISNPIPATCTNNAFKGVNPVTLVIKVPKGCYESFWVHPVFGKFKLEEMDV